MPFYHFWFLLKEADASLRSLFNCPFSFSLFLALSLPFSLTHCYVALLLLWFMHAHFCCRLIEVGGWGTCGFRFPHLVPLILHTSKSWNLTGAEAYFMVTNLSNFKGQVWKKVNVSSNTDEKNSVPILFKSSPRLNWNVADVQPYFCRNMACFLHNLPS